MHATFDGCEELQRNNDKLHFEKQCILGSVDFHAALDQDLRISCMILSHYWRIGQGRDEQSSNSCTFELGAGESNVGFFKRDGARGFVARSFWRKALIPSKM